MKLKEDRELAEKVVKEAMAFLEEFYRVKKERFQKCSGIGHPLPISLHWMMSRP